MKKHTILFAILAALILFMSYTNNPPNGKTGAPGDSICSECHTPQNQNFKGSLQIEGFPAAITPGETYPLTIISRDSIGSAAKGGFQMTILGPLNTRAGTLSSPSTTAAIQVSSGRQYLEHTTAQTFPDSNLLKWTVLWKAENLPTSGTITAYAAANIVNGNFQSTGDRTLTTKVSGEVMLSATDEFTSLTPVLYPNPGSDEIHIQLSGHTNPEGSVYFYNSTGRVCGEAVMRHGIVSVPALPAGMYWLRIREGSEAYVGKWVKI